MVSSPEETSYSTPPIANTNSSPIPRSERGGVRASGRRRQQRSDSSTPGRRPPQTHSSDGGFSTPSSARRNSRFLRPSPRVSSAATPTSTDEVAPSSEAGDDEPEDATPVFVWGTNISVQDVNAAILRFLRHFRDQPSNIDGKYMTALHRILELDGGSGSLEVDARDLFDYDPDLYNKMVRFPLEVLAIFDIVLMDLVARINPLFEKHIQTRIFNLKSSVSMRNLNPSGILLLFPPLYLNEMFDVIFIL